MGEIIPIINTVWDDKIKFKLYANQQNTATYLISMGNPPPNVWFPFTRNSRTQVIFDAVCLVCSLLFDVCTTSTTKWKQALATNIAMKNNRVNYHGVKWLALGVQYCIGGFILP